MTQIMNKLTKLIIAMLTLTAWSCTDENVPEVDIIEEYEYVSLPETTDFDNLSEDELNILYNIENRFQITENENGLYSLKAKSGRDIAVSENIYNYFFKQIEDTNDALLRIVGRRRNAIISRSEGGEDDGRFDCVAYAVYGAGLIDSVEKAKERIGIQRANSGISSDDMLGVLNLFGTFKEVPVRSLEIETFTTPVILVFKPEYSDTYYHAVNGYKYGADGCVECRDYQDYSTNSEYGELKLPLGIFRYAYILVQ